MLILIFLTAAGLMIVASPFVLRAFTDWHFGKQIYTVDSVPPKPVAIVFGAQVYRSGRLSPMLRDRVEAGVDLYKRGKVDVLLMSGFRDEKSTYDEPGAMRRYAIELGVPAQAIVLDNIGLRTYDSCYRAREIFDVHEAILVTQNFHLDRALMLCSVLGLDAVGVAADYQRPQGYSVRTMRWQWWREIAATTVAVLDLLHRPEPSMEATPEA